MYISVLVEQRLPEAHQGRSIDKIIMYEDSGSDILGPYKIVLRLCKLLYKNFTIPSTTDSLFD
jgi:hypothetical protein